jgi:hypothetical protein
MKRLLILSALAIMAAGTTGCHHVRSTVFRQPLTGNCNTCGSAPAYESYGSPVYETAPSTWGPIPSPAG